MNKHGPRSHLPYIFPYQKLDIFVFIADVSPGVCSRPRIYHVCARAYSRNILYVPYPYIYYYSYIRTFIYIHTCSTCIIKKKKKTMGGRPLLHTHAHNLSHIVKVSYFRAFLSFPLASSSLPPATPSSQRQSATIHVHLYMYIRAVYRGRFTLSFCLYIFKRYLRYVECLYRAASSFACAHTQTPARCHRRFSSLTPYCTPPCII